ncbi:MAG: exosortase VPDSG-CTERM-specific [Akkermansiaceae bacterium]|nr:exosortase VPDSG-CTERM-specific [Akkermansiaceae bacterium]
MRNFYVAVAVLVAGFSVPLYHLVQFALQSELYSHTILVPFISLYLVWMKRHSLPPRSRPDHRLAILPLVAGLALLAGRFTSTLDPEDALALTILAFVLLFAGVCMLFLGRQTLRAITFPLGFLVFMAPFPTSVTEWIGTKLQHTSASAAYLFFRLGGTTVFRDDTFFQLPGMKLMVAPECSGIHSTLALFITSLVAGYFFLNSGWKRALLALAVFPLAIFRNGFRVFVIGELCVHIGPEMIDSYIHRHGGPIFFVLSLLPLFLFLRFLMKSESRPRRTAPIAP